ncbi:MAG: DUF748 domain-containing protein, partial [Syntrophobacteraceae bacterium]|nr:DUF748 domain-containing protein [Syntrophobacteraceae bacterium]
MKHALRRVLTSKLLLTPVAAVLLYALVGFVLLPAFVRWYVPRYAKENLGCLAAVDAVRFNPFRLEFEADGFKLHDAQGTQVAAFDRLFVDLQAAGINHWTAKFREVRLEKPSLTVVFQQDGSTNVQRLFPGSEKTTEPAAEPFRMILQNVAIRGGRLEIIDRRQTTPADLKVEEFDLTLKDLSTLGNRNGTYTLSALTHEGETIEWQGDVSLSPVRSTGKITVGNLRTKSLWEFARDRLNIDSPGGQLNISTDYLLDASTAPTQLRLEGLRMDVSDLSLKTLQADDALLELKKAQLQVPSFDLQSRAVTEGLRMDVSELSLKIPQTHETLLELKKAELEAPRFDLQSRAVEGASLLIEGGSASVRIDSTGVVNIMRIAGAKPPRGEKNPKEPLPREMDPGPVETGAQSPPSPPFKLLSGSIQMKGIAFSLEDMSRPVPFMAQLADLDLRFKTDMELGTGENTVILKDVACETKGVRFGGVRSDKPVFKADRLTLEGGELDLGHRSLLVSRIELANGQADVVRDREGHIDWLRLLGTKPDDETASAPKQASGGVAPWKFMVRSIQLEDFRSALSDFTISPDKTLYDLRGVQAELKDVDGKSPLGFTAGFQLEQGGSASLRGRANPSDGSVETELTVKDFPLLPLRPLLDPHVNLTLQSAALSTQGKLRYAFPGADAKLVYEGALSLSKLSFSEPNFEDTYLGFDSMHVPELKFTAEPNRLDAAEVVLSRLMAELIIAQDGSVNVTRWMKGGGGAGKPAAPGGTGPGGGPEAFPFRIGKVRIESGNMVFADFSLRPNFMTKIHELTGTVMGLSSAANAQAKIQLTGRVDQYGLAKIGGELSLYEPKRSTELDMVFRNVEMTTLSPYSGRFAGRRIKSGRLSLDLKYNIKESKLVGDHKIIVDNLVLGERVESPDAVNLP